MALGTNGLILVSTDGVEWTDRSLDTDLRLTGVAHHAGTWVVTTDNKTLVSGNYFEGSGEILAGSSLDSLSPHPTGVVDEGQTGVARVLADPAGPCWLYDDGIACHDEVDGSQLLVAASGVTDLLLTTDHVWYTVRDEPEVGVWRVPRAGGAAEQLVEGAVYDGHFPAALVRDEAAATLYFWTQRDGWPSSAVICALADGAIDAECSAYSPPKPVKPRVIDGELFWITQYAIVGIDPMADETYRVVGTWATSDGLIAGEDGVVWTDAANGRVYRVVP